MKNATKATLAAIALALSACGSVDTATRNAPLEQVSLGGAKSRAVIVEPMQIASYRVNVSRELQVSEANLYYPSGDIVWREDPLGDRHAQVAAIFENSIVKSAGLIQSGRPVDVYIEVKRFHSLTEKARNVGGVHSIKFEISATDAETGAVLMAPHMVNADLKAYGGNAADRAVQKGLTQKFRITNHLIKVIHRELTGQLPQMVHAAPQQNVTPVVAVGTIAQN